MLLTRAVADFARDFADISTQTIRLISVSTLVTVTVLVVQQGSIGAGALRTSCNCEEKIRTDHS